MARGGDRHVFRRRALGKTGRIEGSCRRLLGSIFGFGGGKGARNPYAFCTPHKAALAPLASDALEDPLRVALAWRAAGAGGRPQMTVRRGRGCPRSSLVGAGPFPLHDEGRRAALAEAA